MAASFFWVLLVCGWIQPFWLIHRCPIAFSRKSLVIWWMTFRAAPSRYWFEMLRHPLAVLNGDRFSPWRNIGFLLALSLPLLLIPLLSVDSALLVAVPS